VPHACVLTEYGPPDVLRWNDVAVQEPPEGQIRIKEPRLRSHQSLPMSAAAEAHRLLENGHAHRKLLVTTDAELAEVGQ
jgi:hypothetical protein